MGIYLENSVVRIRSWEVVKRGIKTSPFSINIELNLPSTEHKLEDNILI